MCTCDSSHCCIDPGQAPYANLHYRGVTNDTVFLLPGHYYTYKCWFGYMHDDGSRYKNITCLVNGTWSDPGEAPACQSKMCPNPGIYYKSFSSARLEFRHRLYC